MTRSPIPPLTPRDASALREIQAYWQAHGYGPNLRELAAAMGNATPSVSHGVVAQLEQRRLVETPRLAGGERIARALRLTEWGERALAAYGKVTP